MAGGDNQYTTRVFKYGPDERDVPALVRALHAEMCRVGQLHESAHPACYRAYLVMRRYVADLEAGHELLNPDRAAETPSRVQMKQPLWSAAEGS